MCFVTLWDFLFRAVKLLPQKSIYHSEKSQHMKIFSLILSLSFFAVSASAQIERKIVSVKPDSTQSVTTGDNKVDKQSRKERFRELDLTKEQKGKLKEITQSGKAARENIESNTQLSEDEKKKQLRELQRSQAQKIQAILTPEQREKFKASRPNKP